MLQLKPSTLKYKSESYQIDFSCLACLDRYRDYSRRTNISSFYLPSSFDFRPIALVGFDSGLKIIECKPISPERYAAFKRRPNYGQQI